MDTLLEYLYVDVMRRCWEGSTSKRDARKEWEAAEGKSWEDVTDAALLLADREGVIAFLAGFHLGLTLENTLMRQFDMVF